MVQITNLIAEQLTNRVTLLDLGCGNKRFSNPHIGTHTVTTVDAWPDVKPDHVLNLESDKLPFDDNSFDVVLMIDVIEHLEKEAGSAALLEAQRSVYVRRP